MDFFKNKQALRFQFYYYEHLRKTNISIGQNFLNRKPITSSESSLLVHMEETFHLTKQITNARTQHSKTQS